MRKYIFTICFLLAFIPTIGQVDKSYLEAFTHPINLKPISMYHSPNIYYKELNSDKEGGWIIVIKQKNNNFFEIDIDQLNLYNIWVHIGDIGLVVQNYDSIPITLYDKPDTLSTKSTYIYESCIGLVYDINDKLVLLQINTNNECLLGWVEKKYLCSNPYTTCN